MHHHQRPHPGGDRKRPTDEGAGFEHHPRHRRIHDLELHGASEFAGTQLQFDDDGPTIAAVASTASVRHDETPGVDDTDVAGSAIAFGATTIASLFTNVPSPGDDPDVTGTGAIGFARSTASLLTVTGSAGADGPAAQELSYALSVVNGTDSGVETTGGTKIFMYNGTGAAAGLILGRVGTENAGGDTADPAGTVAFALATNPANGEVFLTQYLSLKHPTPGASHDETITLAAGAVQMSVTRTDGDGDTATDSGNDIGLLVKFDDDGPTITAAASGTASVRHDETPGVQADTDVLGTAFAFGATTIASLFTNVPSPGDDPDVPGTGAIGFARSTNPLATVTGGDAGADGPAAQELSYALSVVNGTDSGVETTGGTKIFMYNGTGAAAGLILGRVGTENAGGDTANAAGTVAFALATNATNGEVFLSQYLSLKHPTGGASHDETITLAAGAVQMSVTRTDGDGDTATDSNNDIGLLVKFDDDGPTISPAIADAQVDFTANSSDGDTGFLDYGADGPASAGPFKITSFEAMPDNTPLGTITETLSVGDTVLTYSSATHGDLFRLTLDATEPGGYTFAVLRDVPNVLNFLDFGSVNPGGPVEEITINAPGGTGVTFDGFLASDFDGTPTSLKAQFGAASGDQNSNPIEDVNVSTQGIGLKDNQMDPNVSGTLDEALKMSFSQDVDGVQVVFDGATGGGNTFSATFEAYDDGVLVDTVTFSNLAAPKGNTTTTVTFTPDPAHDFDELYIALDLADKSGLRIHQVATIEKAEIPDFALDYTVQATDGDADTTSDTFTVKIDSNLDGVLNV
ncbi:DUF5801 repeats-in-toxin domain-containing protein [Bradyrhizobium japonicum]|nr:DUF5801 repeats-in-toxin domain-containing protein [Bradyrhizobium japonicum]WRK50980.1 DUF5801 repeats-in-toxin domain-containing protein [Bradyrhizobium japonicum]